MTCDSATKLMVEAVSDAMATNRPPMAAMVDVARVAVGGDDPRRLLDYLGEWIEKNGDPTWDKLTAWAAGVDEGAGNAGCSLAHLPSIHPIKPGDLFGFIQVQHKQTGEAYVIPYTSGTYQDSADLANRVAKKLDTRAGMVEKVSLKPRAHV